MGKGESDSTVDCTVVFVTLMANKSVHSNMKNYRLSNSKAAANSFLGYLGTYFK